MKIHTLDENKLKKITQFYWGDENEGYSHEEIKKLTSIKETVDPSNEVSLWFSTSAYNKMVSPGT